MRLFIVGVHTHTPEIDAATHSCLQLVSGCLESGLVTDLSVVSGIAPPVFRWESCCVRLGNKAIDSNHLLNLPFTIAEHLLRWTRLTSRKPLRVRMQKRRLRKPTAMNAPGAALNGRIV